VVASLLTIMLGFRANATDVGPAGDGPGGGPFRVMCPAGSFITGFSRRAGDWIDQLQLQCAPC
jgi:hypothetical protein